MEQTACGLVHQLVLARLRGVELLIHPSPKEPILLSLKQLVQRVQSVRRGLR